MSDIENKPGIKSGADSRATANLRRQHKEILQTCDAVDAYLKSDQIESAASDILKLLARLTGQLKVHLSMEDRVMYPHLMEHIDKDVSALAHKYQQEMGSLLTVYQGFQDSYHNTEQIQNDKQNFKDTTRKVFLALRTRIEREDNELYVLVDRVGI